MAKIGTLAALAVLGVVACLGGAQGKVTSMEASQQSLDAHHTSFFKMKDGGIVLRRGQKFDLEVNTDVPLEMNTANAVTVSNTAPSKYNNPEFKVLNVAPVPGVQGRYKVTVKTNADAPVGKYQDVVVSVAEGKGRSEYSYPFPVYLVFNPWLSEDKTVYIPTEELRKEHILNEYGNVYQGSLEDWDSQKWHYGQSNQITLDAAFHLLEKINRKDAGDAIKVIQTMSHNQGMMRNKKTGGILVGTEEALLEGNWGDFPFNETNSPEIWTSSTDVLKRWKSTGKPTQYGQCWVFGALQNALMRAMGVGSRQITAFGAWMDMSMSHDSKKKAHHVIDEFYDLQGSMVYMDGQGWNYHSWNDVWLNRAKDELSGWQGLDGTPPGTIGPAPMASVRSLKEDALPFNVSSIISTVHSTQRTFLVECDDKHVKGKKLDHCKVEKLMRYDHSGLKLMLSSATFENGTLGEHNITSDFIDPSLDAFIPYKDESKFIPWDDKPEESSDSGSGRRLLRGDKKDNSNKKDKTGNNSRKRVDKMIEGAVKLVPSNWKFTVGDSIEGSVEIDTANFTEDEMVQANLMFTLETYQGHEIKKLSSIQERVLIKGSKVVIPFILDNSAYLQKNLQDVFIKIVATGVTEDKRHFFDKIVLDVDAPVIAMDAPSNMTVVQDGQQKASAFSVTSTFTNPHNFRLRNVCLSLHSHELSFNGFDEDLTGLEKCQDLQAGESMTFSAQVEAPTKEGTYYVLSQVQGNYLPYTQSNAEIKALADPNSESATTDAPITPQYDQISMTQGLDEGLTISMFPSAVLF